MLSYQRIGAPHCGHRERGDTMDSCFGRREMQTFRKLPKRSPMTKAASWKRPDVPTVRVYGLGGHASCEA